TGGTDEHAVGAVAGNEVGGGGGRATDEIAERGAIDAHAGKTVGERLFSSEVGADKISLDHGAIHTAHGDAITEARIAGNEIACARGGAANEVPIGTAPNPNPETAITNGIRTRDIGADEISEHKIVARAGIGNINAICLVAGNQIACAWTGSADKVVRRAVPQANAVRLITIGQRRFAADVGADVIALNDIATHADHGNAVVGVAGQQVARTGGCATDGVPAGVCQNPDANVPIAERIGAGNVGADVITEHKIIARARIGNINAICLVAGND